MNSCTLHVNVYNSEKDKEEEKGKKGKKGKKGEKGKTGEKVTVPQKRTLPPNADILVVLRDGYNVIVGEDIASFVRTQLLGNPVSLVRQPSPTTVILNC